MCILLVYNQYIALRESLNMLKPIILVSLLVSSECVYIFSSFWSPLYDRRILNYRVDAPFDSEVAKNARAQYANKHGYRGEKLIADLGNGKGPGDNTNAGKMYGDVRFYFT